MEGTAKRRRRQAYDLRLVAVTLMVGLLGQARIASAVGYGISVKYGHAQGTLAEVDDEFDDLDLTAHGVEVGFVLDTNVARDRIFNYRLVGGFEYAATDWTGAEGFNLYGGSITNTFGFGIWRGPRFRLYLGPDIRLAATTGSPGLVVEDDITQVDIAIGASIGLKRSSGVDLAFDQCRVLPAAHVDGVRRRRSDPVGGVRGTDPPGERGHRVHVSVGRGHVFAVTGHPAAAMISVWAS